MEAGDINIFFQTTPVHLQSGLQIQNVLICMCVICVCVHVCVRAQLTRWRHERGHMPDQLNYKNEISAIEKGRLGGRSISKKRTFAGGRMFWEGSTLAAGTSLNLGRAAHRIRPHGCIVLNHSLGRLLGVKTASPKPPSYHSVL